ncbi:MAG: SWIM zinc finger family protein [Desertimonas sp.]
MRPRAHFGADPKGRLPATMLRALAAELSDPSRFKRAKAYARDQAVFDIQVDPGVVRGMVQGSRPEPYETGVLVSPLPAATRTAADAAATSAVQLMPGRDDLAVTCTCPDVDTAGVVCKHALATLLVFADEVSVEPGLLSHWRSGGALGRPSVGRSRAIARGEPDREREPLTPVVDVLAERRRGPAPLPPSPALAPLARVPVTDDLTEVLALALRSMTSSPRT